MKFIIFNKLNIKERAISIDLKHGIIYFYKTTIKELDLNKLDRLVLAQKENDETNKLKNWYLEKVNPSDINAFILRKNREER